MDSEDEYRYIRFAITDKVKDMILIRFRLADIFQITDDKIIVTYVATCHRLVYPALKALISRNCVSFEDITADDFYTGMVYSERPRNYLYMLQELFKSQNKDTDQKEDDDGRQ